MIYAIHGFLGLPSDWGESFERIRIEDFPLTGFQAWSHALNQKAAQEKEKPYLMGYSLGGRLALHALIAEPDRWKGGIIISSHPGLSSSQLRKERLQSDLQWAELFLKEEWEELMKNWEDQEIFKGGPSFKRSEQDYSREDLAACLRNFSLGNQRNLKNAIQRLPLPLLWVTGEQDLKYKALANTLVFSHSGSKRLEIRGAGHRVPFHLLNEKIFNFIAS